MDGNDGRIISLVFNGFVEGTAFFEYPPFGPEGRGVFVYGARGDGTSHAVEDVVAHEFMHGVTHFSVSQRTGDKNPLNSFYWSPGPRSFRFDNGFVATCDTPFSYTTPKGVVLWPYCEDGRFQLGTGDGGIIHEAFSDIFAHAVEFFHEDRAGPLTGDYVVGEDLGQPFRASHNPGSIEIAPGIPYPDALSRMVRFLVGTPDGGRSFDWIPVAFIGDRFVHMFPDADGGGVHWNATVLSHAFYLAIEGGTNATTGLSVPGVGPANRADVERVFFRAMRELIPPQSRLVDAAIAIHQSAIDLFGVHSATHTAVTQALLAVGFGR